ncbi:Eco57I restriction-modification methylase domain-containing protein [Candidatus Amarolinea aalborgensis]|uniref:Eco57I restriction-modification methylase domain-containing protein n=1 Tax=Candidatus Amarolinea aalborgensis TaxID=2249329 RepID=UPI003BF96540
MPLDTARARRYLKDFDLRTLFIEELGWDQHRQELVIPADGQEFRLQAVAHKRGLAAFRCAAAPDGKIPSYPTRRKIETQVAKSVNQHLIIYTDADQTQQVWQWVKREAGRPTAAREQTFDRNRTGEALIQKLQAVAFSLEEEESLTLVDVAGRVKAGFDVERVTRRFYERFKTEHAAFLKFLTGIPDEGLQRWYASVMINRLMFIYFIQKKGFLDGDPNYLRTRLTASQATAADRYYTDFLCPLFFEGFARRPAERAAATRRLLGQVPYLNGGIFERHQIETAHGQTIRVPDAAFARLFDFFDAYQWRLDERPLAADNEINPDVLGYIFEKYINQKQMGAYYTKEDITGYISQNTIIPYLLDAAQRECRIAFVGEQTVWRLLAADPDRYIYPALRHGAELTLPPEIADGLDTTRPDLLERRQGWNRPAPAAYALPTEIWREIVARRQRYAEVRARLAGGETCQVNDLITLNLDIRQFAQDLIAECEGPELLRAFWRAIESVTILDPTVGSGAFLFAALNVLEPLYEGCLQRMQAFVDDLDRSGEPHRPEKFSDFRKVLTRVAQHPNRRYFILKSIVVNNLYGVDIMEEAVEICKLRLFLKLVAQVAVVEDIEPLPDIDFNVRAGNTLVGYVSRDDVQRALTFAGQQGRLLFAEEAGILQRFEARAADVERLFGLFRQQQTELGGQVTAADKAELRRRLDALDDELNRALAREYGVDTAKAKAYKDWLASHRPLHWFVEFYGIMRRGGFDVVIGNPPYVEYKDVRSTYEIRNFVTDTCSNLFAFVTERCSILGQQGTRVGIILPLSAFSTDRMIPLITLLKRNSARLFISYFGWRPGKLFDGVNLQLSILLQVIGGSLEGAETTRYLLWDSNSRSELFSKVAYARVDDARLPGSIPKLGMMEAASILKKLRLYGKEMGGCFTRSSQNKVFYRRGGLYWKVFVDFETGSSEEKIIHLLPDIDRYAIIAALSSGLWWWYFTITSDCRHLGNRDIETFPYDPRKMNYDQLRLLSQLGRRYVEHLRLNAEQAVRVYKGTKTVECMSFRVNQAKPIIDEIDRVLARHYGFTDEELDFIINYDIKYRMGDELEGDV